MRSDTLSILGLYNYDNTIFDLLTIPESLDKTTLIKSICAELADMELLYPNPEVMKDLIGVWSAGCQYEWNKLYESMQFEYNPLDNYDRTETRTLTSQGSGSGTDGGSDSSSRTLTSQGSGSGTDGGSDSLSTSKQHSGQEQDTGKVTAFNSATLADKNQSTGTSSATDTETASTQYGKTKQETFSKSDSEQNTMQYGKTKQESFNKTDSETIRAHGNIGVTTTMQMIREQRDIVKFNLYDIITEEFKLRFCVLVY